MLEGWAGHGALALFAIKLKGEVVERHIMASATVTSKGRITIPVSVREDLGLKAGSRVKFMKIAEGQYVIVPALSIKSMAGRFHVPGRRAASIEEMNEAIAEAGASAGKITR